jgi:hypothetical protein
MNVQVWIANAHGEIARFGVATAKAWGTWLFPVVVAVAILVPQCITQMAPYGLELPRIFGEGTDEEAYLVLLNSVIQDGDFDLRNNYRAAEMGSRQGGLKAAGHRLFHHSTYYVKDERLIHLELQQRGINPATLGPEYPAHPVGIALLLAPIVWPFRSNLDLVESLSVICAGLSIVISMLLFRRILASRGSSVAVIRLATIAVFLSSPVWFYSRTFFNEAFILFAVVGAYWAVEIRRSSLLAGAFIAAAMLMKPHMALFLVALAIPILADREWKQLSKLLVFPTGALILMLLLNAHMYGSPFRAHDRFHFGDPVEAFVGLLISRERGLIWYSPALLLGFVGWWMALRTNLVRSAPVVLGALMQFGVVLLWAGWTGGWCYGPRLLVPILPLLGLGLACVLSSKVWERFLPRWLLYNVIAYGVLINGLAVTRYWIAWTTAGGPPKFLGRLLWLELT